MTKWNKNNTSLSTISTVLPEGADDPWGRDDWDWGRDDVAGGTTTLAVRWLAEWCRARGDGGGVIFIGLIGDVVVLVVF